MSAQRRAGRKGAGSDRGGSLRRGVAWRGVAAGRGGKRGTLWCVGSWSGTDTWEMGSGRGGRAAARAVRGEAEGSGPVAGDGGLRLEAGPLFSGYEEIFSL